MICYNFQFFGGRGSGGGKGVGGGAGGGGYAHIGKAEVDAWIDTQSPGDFLSAAPESVSIQGVEFKWFTESKIIDSKGRTTYHNTYTSTRQASNGEWPILETVVVETRRGKIKKYQFDRSTFGTGLR